MAKNIQITSLQNPNRCKMSDQKLTPPGKIITGYKATDKDMMCRGHQFELGTWYEHSGDLSLCESGFHFCEYPSGPWAYYRDDGTRLFKCEAEVVLLSTGPGADLKHVAKKIRLTEEIKITGDGNTGYSNTGDGNTGNRNTGNRNTGNRNTGGWNTGHGNTGYSNTGDGNAGSNHSGFFNVGDAPFIVFGKESDKKNFDFELAYKLAEKLSIDEKFDYEEFLKIPNATLKKITELHQEHIKLRKKMKDEK
jgi:hypothetical protein